MYSQSLWRRQWDPTPVLLPGKSQGWRSLVGCSPWGREESDTTERLHFHFSLSCIGEGNGNPLQCSCLENLRDGATWWAAVYGVAQSRTWLKRLSSSSRSKVCIHHHHLTLRFINLCKTFVPTSCHSPWLQNLASGNHSSTFYLYMCVCALSHLSHVQLFANLMDCRLPASSVQGILQRILEWVSMLSSRGSSQPRDRTHISSVSCFDRQVLYH